VTNSSTGTKGEVPPQEAGPVEDTVRYAVGGLLVKAQKKGVLPGLILIGALVAGCSVFGAEIPLLKGVAFFGIVFSAVCVFLDRLATRRKEADKDKETARKEAEKDRELELSRASELSTAEESEKRAEMAVDALNVFIQEAHSAMVLEGEFRKQAVAALPRTMVIMAAKFLGDDGRASYYSLTDGTPHRRRLTDPVHCSGVNRTDQSQTPFLEADKPNIDVWRILDREDVEPEVRTAPDAVLGLTWDVVRYKEFYSVPVKVQSKTFGFFSVNSAVVGTIGGPQRACVLAMARVLALVCAS
jgi:hypothetical protein